MRQKRHLRSLRQEVVCGGQSPRSLRFQREDLQEVTPHFPLNGFILVFLSQGFISGILKSKGFFSPWNPPLITGGQWKARPAQFAFTHALCTAANEVIKSLKGCAHLKSYRADPPRGIKTQLNSHFPPPTKRWLIHLTPQGFFFFLLLLLLLLFFSSPPPLFFPKEKEK